MKNVKRLKNTLRRSLSLLLVAVMIVFSVPVLNLPVKAVSFNDINQSSVFIKQSTNYTCTLASAVMLVRRTAMAAGNNNWASITESSMRGTAWLENSGLYYSFTYAGVSVGHATISSNRKSTFISLLNRYPQGVVAWNNGNGGQWHAVLLTDYDAASGTIYCADPAGGTNGRVPLSSSTIVGSGQDGKINNCTDYWYVKSPSISLTSNDTQAPTISNVRVTDVSYIGYTVTCDVSDNVGVTRVAFPTWTGYNGEDDVTWKDGTINGNTATFRVNVSEHNYEYGAYITHIYAYDAAGNNCSVAAYATVPIGEEIKDTFYNGSRYVLYKASASWSDAKRYCESIGGHLATVTSKGENTIITSMVSSYGKTCWLGATDEVTEGVWKWVTGEKFDFTNWDANEPNNDTDGQDYLAMYNSGWWDDRNIGVDGFICELSVNKIGTVLAEKTYNGHRYVLYDADVTWDVARAYCESIGGYLVTITSTAEQNVVNGLLSDYTEHVWAGATDVNSEGNWMWYTGETFRDSYWAEKQPDNNGSGENYLELNFQNKWNDCVGDEKQGFVCEFGNVWDDEINEETSTVYNKHKYILFDTSISWTMAQSYCESIGGHLVTITDKAENDAMIKLIAKGSKNLYWTGLYDGDSDGVFEWITGEKLSYTNWAIGEPSQTSGKICGQIYAKSISEKVCGCWNDESNTSWFTPNTFYYIDNVGFICELDSFDCSHTSSNWIIDKQPTCAKEGSKYTQCITCGKVLETQSIAKLQHTYVKGEVVAPTCEHQGYTTYACSGCGDTYYNDFTQTLPHTDVDADGVCDDCGTKISECTCACHKSGIVKIFFNFILFFQKLFGQNKTCACGVNHY